MIDSLERALRPNCREHPVFRPFTTVLETETYVPHLTSIAIALLVLAGATVPCAQAQAPSRSAADSLPGAPEPIRGAHVTQVDLIRAGQILDLPQRLDLLEGFLRRPMRDELRPMVLRMIVSTCRELGDLEAATFYGEEALRLNPSDGPVLLELAAAYADDPSSDVPRGIGYAKRAMDALEAAAKAMGEGGEERLSTFVGSLLKDWGWMLLRSGNVKEAEPMLLEAAERRKDPEVYVRLGTLRKGAGKLSQAKDDFAMALALSSGEDVAAREAMQEIVTAEGGGEADIEAIVSEKRSEIARMKKEAMAEHSRVAPAVAPGFELNTLDGGKVALKDLKGSVVVLDFWATWCGPCRRELPVIQKAYESFREAQVAVLAVSVDTDTSLVRPYVKANNLTLPVAFGGTAGRDYGASSIPTLVVIDGNGMLRYVHTGYHPDLEEVLPEEIRELLEEL